MFVVGFVSDRNEFEYRKSRGCISMWFQLESDYIVIETIGVVFVLMLQSVRRNYWSGICINVTEC